MSKILEIRRAKPANLIKAIMQEETIRPKGNLAVKYAQKLNKQPGFDFLLTMKSEYKTLKNAVDYFKREFNVKELKVQFAEKSDHPKAKVAEPGRPGIAITFKE
jgi:hypothetical protein